MDKEKMIVVEKSTKWWMGVVAAGSLAVGALGGFSAGALVSSNVQQNQAVQATNSTETNTNMPDMNGGQPPQMQGGGPGGSMQGGGQPPQMQGGPDGNMGDNAESNKSAPANADGTTKSDSTSGTSNSSAAKS